MKFLLALLIVAAFVPCVEASEKIALKIGDKIYYSDVKNNITAQEIFKNIPLNLEMKRYAEHEYFSELSFRPKFAEERTSHIKAGNIYYWDGWNAFVINYEDYDISPYKVVHIGTVDKAEELCNYLRSAGENVNVSVDSGKE